MISNISSMLQFCLVLMLAVVGTSERYVIPESKITEVTIGGTIAQVTRAFPVQHVTGGSHTIVVSHLPLAVDEKSIQITGKGSATVVSTVFENQVTYKESDGEYVARIQMLDALTKSISAFEHKLSQENKTVTARLNAVAQYVEDVVSRNPSHTAPTRIPIEQLAELLDYQEKELQNSNGKVVALNVVRAAVRELAEGVGTLTAALRKTGAYKNDLLLQELVEVSVFPALSAAWGDLRLQVDALPSAPRRWPLSSQSKQLHINIHVPKSDSDASEQLSFEVQYTVSPASWAVEYDLRVQKSANPTASAATSSPYSMRVGLYAVVAQSTREDWEQVQLHLSTTQAQQRINAPAPPTRLSLDFRSQDIEYGGTVGNVFLATAGAPMHKSASPMMERASMAADEVEMKVAGAGFTGSSGQVGSPVVFHPEHATNITSNHQDRDSYSSSSGGGSGGPAVTRSTRMFIREAVLHPAVFSYCVPTRQGPAYIKAWTTGKAASTDTIEMPLLESHSARVFIEDALTGTTSVQATQPGSPVRVDLGQDQNIQVTSTHILPQKGSRTDDKSTWFVTDKVKYLVENVEHAFSVRSTYDAPQLVVLSEYLPHAGDEGIKVELLQPAATSTLSVAGTGSADDLWSEQDFIAAVLAHPSLASPPTSAAKDDRMQAFAAKGSGNVVWARWVQPGETVRAGLQYKIIWPDGKKVQKNWHPRY